MIQFMEIVPSWFIAFWKDSLTFLLSHIQVGDSECESLDYEMASSYARLFKLDIRKKKIITSKAVKHWNRLPRKAVDSQSLEVLKDV